MTSIALVPDRAAIQRHLDCVAGRGSAVQPNLKVEIAWGEPDAGPNRARLFPVSQRPAAVEFAASVNGTGCNVYVGTTLKNADAPSDRRTSSQHAAIATCVAIDIDQDLAAGARKLPVRPQLLVLTGRTPNARGHLWIGIEATSDMALWDELTGRAVALCNGDMGARGRSRVMRLGGTVSYPSGSKQRRGYVTEPVTVHSVNAPIYDLAELINAFPGWGAPVSAVELQAVAQRRRNPSPTDLDDVMSALAALPPIHADDHDLWLRTGFALHSFDAGPAGLALWRQFSERNSAKALLTNFERRWSSFGPPGGRQPITIRWLFAQARAHGWRPQRASTRHRWH